MQYVYLLRAGENHYKVGVATNIRKRVSGIQTSNPNKIQVVTTKMCEDAYAIEGQLHVQLQQMKTNGGTEWFVLSDRQALELAVTINELPDINIENNIKLRDILKRHEANQERIERKLNIVTDLAAAELARKEAEAVERAANKLEPKPEKEVREVVTDEQLFKQAIQVGMAFEKVSTSLLQRKLRIGYGRAARLVEELEEQGIVTEMDGSRPRSVNMEKALMFAQNIIEEPATIL